jgi:multiple RNA-binding domain-containing protein 1
MLDKHKLTLQLSKRTATGSASDSKASKRSKDDGSKGAKLVVRNVAFEATRKDIMGLFGPFGHIKSCRWVLGPVGLALLVFGH